MKVQPYIKLDEIIVFKNEDEKDMCVLFHEDGGMNSESRGGNDILRSCIRTSKRTRFRTSINQNLGVGASLVVNEFGGDLFPELKITSLRVNKVVVHCTRIRHSRCKSTPETWNISDVKNDMGTVITFQTPFQVLKLKLVLQSRRKVAKLKEHETNINCAAAYQHRKHGTNWKRTWKHCVIRR